METLLIPFTPRYIILTICAVVTALLIAIGIFDNNVKVWELLAIPIVIFGALTALGIRDLTQKSHAVLRNYPISAHIRFLLEEEAQMYFSEQTFEYPLAAGVQPASVLPPLEFTRVESIDFDQLGGDLESTRALIREAGLEG